MKIDLTKIPAWGKEVSFSLEPDWWKQDFIEDRIVGLESPLFSRLKISPTGEKVAVDGFLSARVLLRCDRCLETFSEDVATNFQIYLSLFPYKGEAEVELLENDLNLDFIDGNFLELDQIIREQLILNLPMKTLCRKECKGLCPLCGCNLNAESCSCQSKYKTSLYK